MLYDSICIKSREKEKRQMTSGCLENEGRAGKDRKERLQRSTKKLWWCFQGYINRSKLTKLYYFNICNLWYVNDTSLKLLKMTITATLKMWYKLWRHRYSSVTCFCSGSTLSPLPQPIRKQSDQKLINRTILVNIWFNMIIFVMFVFFSIIGS